MFLVSVFVLLLLLDLGVFLGMRRLDHCEKDLGVSSA
jgi:fumarate reductase subunit D